ncbi:MAG: hypothetical protein QME51_10020 [Planctomycetota bacterium]|nr:hypothetical protein [Planctomycetota bacterium]MDI6788694.1 hypothetical protein [Planctomycetota bacterium]
MSIILVFLITFFIFQVSSSRKMRYNFLEQVILPERNFIAESGGNLDYPVFLNQWRHPVC